MATITLPVKALIQLLNTAVLFAGDDETLPMLRCAQIERVGDELVAAGTNRFLLGVNVVNAKFEDVPDDHTMMVTRDDVALIATSYGKAARGSFARITVTDEGWSLRVDGHAVRLEIEKPDYEFPKWRQLMGGEYGEMSPGVLLDSGFLQLFGKAKRSTNDPVRVRFPKDSGRPVQVVIQDYFIGIIMPVRDVSRDGSALLGRLGIDA